MNNIVAQIKAPSQEQEGAGCLIELCHRLNLVPIPLKPKSKVPLVKWSAKQWQPSSAELKSWASTPGINWGVRGGENLAAIDIESEDEYFHFIGKYQLPPDCPVVKTGRGYHIWVKPRRPIRSQRVNGIELKCLGSYVVAPPSIHPSGSRYVFQVAPNGSLPVVDLEDLLNLPKEQYRDQVSGSGPDHLAAPSDFALHYGKSPYPPSLCGLATKVLTRSDGKVKRLLGLRCWKWYCPKCSPLLKSYWLDKLNTLSFRFILRSPRVDKPATFLRHIGKPDYAHIVANGESWLFLTDGEAEKVWSEAKQVGYELIAGDITGDPTPKETARFLEQALSREEAPLNTRRKITHSRGLFTKIPRNDKDNESKQNNKNKEDEDMCAASGEKPSTWNSEVVLKPINEVAEELEAQGWRVLWQSEVEAIAIKNDQAGCLDTGIVELMENLGIKLKKVGNEYKGLCPFHDDHDPSLSVNREKGLWHCFGCERGGDYRAFVDEWQKLADSRGFRQFRGG